MYIINLFSIFTISIKLDFLSNHEHKVLDGLKNPAPSVTQPIKNSAHWVSVFNVLSASTDILSIQATLETVVDSDQQGNPADVVT